MKCFCFKIQYGVVTIQVKFLISMWSNILQWNYVLNTFMMITFVPTHSFHLKS